MLTRLASIGLAGVLALAWGLQTAAKESAQAITLTGDTSEPVLSTFVLGEPVELGFTVEGMEGGQRLSLKLRFLDEHDELLGEKELAVQADEQGRWEGGVADVPREKLGFYRVEAELSNGVKLQRLGTREAGYLTYAVVPDPAQRKDYGEQRTTFGMQGGFGPWGNRSLQLLGARWVLDGNFEWRRNEPERPGQLAAEIEKNPKKWQAAEPREWNTYALPTLMAAPKWAVDPATFSYMTGKLLPEHESSWQEYCREAVRAFMRKYPGREQRIYQITWEPQPPWGFKGRLADVVRIYELAYPVIHEEDPNGLVAGPTLGLQHDADLRTTAEIFQLGLGNYLDVYSCHPYFSKTPERDGMVQKIRAAKAVVLDREGNLLPMIGTEQGQNTGEKREAELQHAKTLIRQNLITLGEGFRFNMTYYIVDYKLANQKGYGYYYCLVDGIPWGPAKAGPKPAVPAYAAQSLLLDGAEAVRAIDWLGDTALGYAFERDGQVVLALWDYSGQPRKVSLPVGVDQVTLQDWMGNPQSVRAGEGQAIDLTLKAEPVYVIGASPAIWGRESLNTLTLEQGEWVYCPGDTVTLEPAIAASKDKSLRGRVIVEADSRLKIDRQQVAVALDAGQRKPLSIPLQLSGDVRPGNYAIQLRLEEDGRVLAVGGRWLSVAPPVEVERVEPFVSADSTPGLRVTLRNGKDSDCQGRLMVQVRELMESSLVAKFKLGSGAGNTYEILLPGLSPQPLGRYPVKITTALDDPDQMFDDTRAANWLAAVRADHSLQADGDLSDWQDAAMCKPVRAMSDDLDVTVGITWDADALYLAARVRDDVFVQNWSSHDTWRGDCLQLSINLDPHREVVASGNELADATLRARKSTITLALTPEGVQAYRYASFDADALPTGLLMPDHVAAAVNHDGQELTYELAIPWQALGGEPPQPGQYVGIGMDVRDLDAADWNKTSTFHVFAPVGAKVDEGSAGLIQLGVPTENAADRP